MILRVAKIDMWLLILNSLVLLGTITASHVSLKTSFEEHRQQYLAHIAREREYLLRETWSERNRFIDEKLDRMEKKIDQLHDLMEVRKR